MKNFGFIIWVCDTTHEAPQYEETKDLKTLMEILKP
jgi:hypothetical protein